MPQTLSPAAEDTIQHEMSYKIWSPGSSLDSFFGYLINPRLLVSSKELSQLVSAAAKREIRTTSSSMVQLYLQSQLEFKGWQYISRTDYCMTSLVIVI
jgi:hypothetical protein